MKVAIYVSRFLPATGGIIFHVIYLVNDLIRQGVNVEIHTGNVITLNKKRIMLKRSHIEVLGKIGIIIERDLLPIFPLHIRAFEKSDADVLNIHGYAELFTSNLLLTLRRLKKPIILTSHGALQTTLLGMYYTNSIFQSGTMIAKRAFAKSITLNLLRRYVDTIIASSDEEKSMLLLHGLNAERVIIIKNFVPDQYFAYKPDDDYISRILEQYAVEPYNYVITVSRIDYNKGLHQVVKALACLYKSGVRKIKYLIVGPDEGALNFILSLSDKLGIRHSVVYLGKITDKKIILALNRFSLAFVYPLYAGAAHSLAVIEAMSQRTPIIVSNTLNSICKHVKHHINGLVFKYGNFPSLAQAIRMLLEDESLRKRLGETAFKYAYEHHRLSKAVNRYMKIYKTLYKIYYKE